MAKREIGVLLVLLGIACGDSGGDDAGVYTPGDAGPRRACADEDGDGYDLYCGARLDCDDEDPNVGDECFYCLVPTNPGCPCEPGTKQEWCNPDDIRTVQDGVAGIIRCEEGWRYCRDGAWSECEIIARYAMFIPD